MTGKEPVKILKSKGCIEVRQRGSHVTLRCPRAPQVTVPVHTGKTFRPARSEPSNGHSSPGSEGGG